MCTEWAVLNIIQYSVQCTLYCTLYSIHIPMCTECAVLNIIQYSVQCTLYCTLYTIHIPNCTECAVLYSMVQVMALALALLESSRRVFLASLATVKDWQLATVTQTGTTAATPKNWQFDRFTESDTVPQDWLTHHH